jgi:hypothetical protein
MMERRLHERALHHIERVVVVPHHSQREVVAGLRGALEQLDEPFAHCRGQRGRHGGILHYLLCSAALPLNGAFSSGAMKHRLNAPASSGSQADDGEDPARRWSPWRHRR